MWDFQMSNTCHCSSPAVGMRLVAVAVVVAVVGDESDWSGEDAVRFGDDGDEGTRRSLLDCLLVSFESVVPSSNASRSKLRGDIQRKKE